MDRRTFIKQSAFMTSAFVLPKIPGLLTDSIFAKSRTQTFSLNLITDKPQKTLYALETVLKTSWTKNLRLTYSETTLPGAQMADIVFLRNNRLIDYRNARDDFSQRLLELGREMGLPRKMTDPVLVQFATQNQGAKAREIALYHRNVRVAELSLDVETEQEIRGTQGKLIVSIEGRTASIKHSSCKHKTCMKMGKLSKAGQSLVCIPNEIRIAVAGDNEMEIDSVSF